MLLTEIKSDFCPEPNSASVPIHLIGDQYSRQNNEIFISGQNKESLNQIFGRSTKARRKTTTSSTKELSNNSDFWPISFNQATLFQKIVQGTANLKIIDVCYQLSRVSSTSLLPENR
jgi:hypothetical protein